MAVFETGGGSAQFTFGHGTHVEEQFSVEVGAVALTERFRLAGPVSDETRQRAALDAIAGDLTASTAAPAPSGRRGRAAP